MLISPAEPLALRQIGTVSSQCEKMGADFLIPSKQFGLVGVQRKEVKDFVNSVHDGRLGKELGQMLQLGVGCLILEGDFKWTVDGTSLVVTSWSQMHHNASLFSIQSQGYWILCSRTITETIALLSQLEKWLQKETHSLLKGRPGPTSPWGKAGNKEWALHFLQGIPGIGQVQAERIIQHFSGIPLQWTVTDLDLLSVDGLGPKRVQAMMEIFDEN